MTLYDFVDDSSAVVDHFNEVFDKVILLGHSEGALIGALVATSNKNVHSFISISGNSTSLDSLILDQLAKYPKLVPLAKKHIQEIKDDVDLSEVNPMLWSLFRESIRPFLKSCFEINPMEAISKVKVNTLIIGGGCDLQVPIDHASNLHKATPNGQHVEISNMGHLMKELSSDCSDSRSAYTDPTKNLNSKLVEAVIAFIQD